MLPKLQFSFIFGRSFLGRRSESAFALLHTVLRRFQTLPGFGRGCRAVSSPGRLRPRVLPSVSAVASPAALVASRQEGQRLAGSDGQMLSQPLHGLWVRAAHKGSATSLMMPGVCGWTSPARRLGGDRIWDVRWDLGVEGAGVELLPDPVFPCRGEIHHSVCPRKPGHPPRGRQGRGGQHPSFCEYS